MKERTKMYVSLGSLWLAGCAWLTFSSATTHGMWKGCLTKQFLGMPCPSCGTTRAVRHIFQGDLSAAWHYNPIGIFMAIVMVGLPFWMLYDLLRRDDSLWRTYQGMERTVRRPWVAVSLVLLLIANWIWNFIKYG